MNAFVARQAIFDRKREVFGYELLFRAHDGSAGAPLRSPKTIGTQTEVLNETLATVNVLAASMLSIGLGNMVGTSRAFVNFERDTLLSDWHATLPSEVAVIEVLETVAPEQDVLQACRKMRAQGYWVALDDYPVSRLDQDTPDPFLDVCNVVKIEVGCASPQRLEEIVAEFHQRGLLVLAEKVETYDEFHWALNAGFDLFQGYFFARPEVLKSREVGALKLSCLRLLRESQRPELDFDQLEYLIGNEVSFAYKLLRYVNSALLGSRKEIRSVRQALLYLGSVGLRKWVAMAALPAAGNDKPTELVLHSLTRARMCQMLAQSSPRTRQQEAVTQAAFLIGLFSLLDALVDQSLPRILEDIGLDPELADVLLGTSQDAPLAHVFRLATAYERAQWEETSALSERLGLDPAQVTEAYVEALSWAKDVLFLIDDGPRSTSRRKQPMVS